MASLFHEVTRETIRVTENGRSREMTKMEAILRQLAIKAMSGDPKAMAEVLRLDRVFALVVADGDPPDSPDAAKDQVVLQRLLSRMRGVQDQPTTEPATEEDFDGDPSR